MLNDNKKPVILLAFANSHEGQRGFLRGLAKEQSEIDFVLQDTGKGTFHFLEAKLGIHGAQPFQLDSEAKKVFSPPYRQTVVSAGGGQKSRLNHETMAVPIQELGNFLLDSI